MKKVRKIYDALGWFFILVGNDRILHREDGPAVYSENHNDIYEWFLDDQNFSQRGWLLKILQDNLGRTNEG